MSRRPRIQGQLAARQRTATYGYGKPCKWDGEFGTWRDSDDVEYAAPSEPPKQRGRPPLSEQERAQRECEQREQRDIHRREREREHEGARARNSKKSQTCSGHLFRTAMCIIGQPLACFAAACRMSSSRPCLFARSMWAGMRRTTPARHGGTSARGRTAVYMTLAIASGTTHVAARSAAQSTRARAILRAEVMATPDYALAQPVAPGAPRDLTRHAEYFVQGNLQCSPMRRMV